MKIAYFDSPSGISGDMIIGALIDAGLDIDGLDDGLKALHLPGYRIRKEVVFRGGIRGVRFLVDVEGKDRGRKINEIIEIIETSNLDDDIKVIGKGIFLELSRIEAKIHGERIDEVFLHEIGTLDSIIDIIGTLIGIKRLGITSIYSSPINLGRGLIYSKHGRLPIPSPATLELVKGLPVYSDGIEGELTTPTGAVLIKMLAKGFGRIPKMRLLGVGYGAGEMELEIPNLLRIYIGEEVEGYVEDEVVVIETNIDDMNPEFLDYIIQRLISEGALDAFTIPIGMKKNRIGSLLSVLAPKELLDRIVSLIFMETTTFGVRIHHLERRRLNQETIHVRTRFGRIKVKVGRLCGKILNITPEYEDCKRLASRNSIPLKEIYDEAKMRAKDRLMKEGRYEDPRLASRP